MRALTRRQVLAAVTASACAHTGPVSNFRTLRSWLPRETVTGQPFAPEKLEGRVVLVTFLATWCFPCVADLRSLKSLRDRFGARGFQNVLVGMDLEGALVLEPFVQQFGIEDPLVVADARLHAGETPFGKIRELPSRFLFNREGDLVTGFAGVTTPAELAQLVETWL